MRGLTEMGGEIPTKREEQHLMRAHCHTKLPVKLSSAGSLCVNHRFTPDDAVMRVALHQREMKHAGPKHHPPLIGERDAAPNLSQ